MCLGLANLLWCVGVDEVYTAIRLTWLAVGRSLDALQDTMWIDLLDEKINKRLELPSIWEPKLVEVKVTHH